MLSKFSFMWGIFFCLKKSYKKILVLVYVLSICISILFFMGIKVDGKW